MQGTSSTPGGSVHGTQGKSGCQRSGSEAVGRGLVPRPAPALQPRSSAYAVAVGLMPRLEETPRPTAARASYMPGLTPKQGARKTPGRHPKVRS